MHFTLIIAVLINTFFISNSYCSPEKGDQVGTFYIFEGCLKWGGSKCPKELGTTFYGHVGISFAESFVCRNMRNMKISPNTIYGYGPTERLSNSMVPVRAAVTVDDDKFRVNGFKGCHNQESFPNRLSQSLQVLQRPAFAQAGVTVEMVQQQFCQDLAGVSTKYSFPYRSVKDRWLKSVFNCVTWPSHIGVDLDDTMKTGSVSTVRNSEGWVPVRDRKFQADMEMCDRQTQH